ncbi:MAG TPA: cellulase family glycosylhydrolase [Terriglobales bacterium]|nr:cellulase family glycosylhydrolase [Terriglobales bacterium]
MRKPIRVSGLLAAALLAAAIVGPAPAAAKGAPNDNFVKRDGSDLTLNGKQFDFVGTNNYYLMYSSHLMVDSVLNTAAANGFNVMRTWGWLDQTPKNGIVFQTFDGTSITYNDTATGLANLDYTVAQAGKLGIKLVIPFTGNWSDFGGIDQYVKWAGGSFHDDFYTNATIKTWYKAWISHLLNHVNTITGVAYKNDPTIMTWELANEPRCSGGSSTYPQSANCTTATITGWAAEMSAYIKSLDKKHLVSSGSEGFLVVPGSTEYERSGASGVDELAISKLPTIDVMSYHLYPDGGWSKTVAWGTTWITDHTKLAKKIGKPSMLGEFGLKDQVARNVTYKTWTDAVRNSGGNGALFWILTGKQDDGTLYPDYDGFRINCPSPVCTTLANAVIGVKDQRRFDRLSPVADNLSATVEFAQIATYAPAASAVAYGYKNAPVAGKIDLNTALAGQQKSITVTGGTFALQTNGTVTFTPATGFHGPASTTFTIQDKEHRTSNVATLSVFVKPSPPPPLLIGSFETGTDGWTSLSATSATQSTDWASEGTHSLLITATIDWTTNVWYNTPLNLTNNYTAITFDVYNQSSSAWGYFKVAIKDGAGTWCDNGGVSLQPNASGPMAMSLNLTTCAGLNGTLQQIMVYSAGNAYLDNIVVK